MSFTWKALTSPRAASKFAPRSLWTAANSCGKSLPVPFNFLAGGRRAAAFAVAPTGCLGGRRADFLGAISAAVAAPNNEAGAAANRPELHKDGYRVTPPSMVEPSTLGTSTYLLLGARHLSICSNSLKAILPLYFFDH